MTDYPVHAQHLERLFADETLHQQFTKRSPVALADLDSDLYTTIQAQLGFAEEGNPVVHRVHFLKTAWFRYAAAIPVLLGVGLIAYFWNFHPKNASDVTINTPVAAKDILPGGNKVVLTC